MIPLSKKKYVIVGTGGRAEFFYGALVTVYNETSELVAICDVNQTRMNFANQMLTDKYGYHEVPTYKAENFDRMIAETKPDYVLVTTIDRTHHKYIIRAMELGCDVISEKPMTIDEEKCQEIFDAIRRTGKNLRVTFNYRYAPHNTKIREVIMDGVLGEILSVNFEWSAEHPAWSGLFPQMAPR